MKRPRADEVRTSHDLHAGGTVTASRGGVVDRECRGNRRAAGRASGGPASCSQRSLAGLGGSRSEHPRLCRPGSVTIGGVVGPAPKLAPAAGRLGTRRSSLVIVGTRSVTLGTLPTLCRRRGVCYE